MPGRAQPVPTARLTPKRRTACGAAAGAAALASRGREAAALAGPGRRQSLTRLGQGGSRDLTLGFSYSRSVSGALIHTGLTLSVLLLSASVPCEDLAVIGSRKLPLRLSIQNTTTSWCLFFFNRH